MRLKANIFKWSLKVRLWVLGGLLCVVGILAFFSSQIGHETVDWVQAKAALVHDKAQLNVRQIEVAWEKEFHYTTRADIEKAVDLKQGVSMSHVDLTAIRERIEQLPWIRSCIVERYLPNYLRIFIVEKNPIAIWQNNKKYHPLDEFAEPIETSKKMPSDLLLVVGEDAPAHLLNLLAALSTVPEIHQYVRSAVWVGKRRWNLKLFDAEKGVEVLLPEGDELLMALKRLEATDKKERLIKRKIRAIDMRQQDKIILRPIESKKADKEKKK